MRERDFPHPLVFSSICSPISTTTLPSCLRRITYSLPLFPCPKIQSVSQRTAPAGQASIQAAQGQDLSQVTDGTQIPFDGATDAYVTDSSSSPSSKGGKPKFFDA